MLSDRQTCSQGVQTELGKPAWWSQVYVTGMTGSVCKLIVLHGMLIALQLAHRLYMQVMHIAAVSEITNLLLPSLKTLHVSPHLPLCFTRTRMQATVSSLLQLLLCCGMLMRL